MNSINDTRKIQGFTIVEFIMISMIIGIIAAMIVPKFIDLKTQTRQKTVKGIAASLTAASATNFQLYRVGSNKAVTIQSCQDVENAFPSAQALPANCEIFEPVSPGNPCRLTCTYNSTAVTEEFMIYRTSSP